MVLSNVAVDVQEELTDSTVMTEGQILNLFRVIKKQPHGSSNSTKADSQGLSMLQKMNPAPCQQSSGIQNLAQANVSIDAFSPEVTLRAG